jgi:hypothetical protein
LLAIARAHSASLGRAEPGASVVKYETSCVDRAGAAATVAMGVGVAAAEGVSTVLAADGMGDLTDAAWWERP